MSVAQRAQVSPGTAHLTTDMLRLLDGWLPEQRWYPVSAQGVTHEPWLTVTFPGIADVVVVLLRLTGSALTSDAASLVIQVPLVLAPTAEPITGRIDSEAMGLIGTVATAAGIVTMYDGGTHPAAWNAYLTTAIPDAHGADSALSGEEVGDALTGARRISGEQSNTSVVLPELTHEYGRGGMLKILRTVMLGPHPDVAIPEALTRDGWTGAPRFLGAVELPTPDDFVTAPGHEVPHLAADTPWGENASGPLAHLAVFSELITDATDGFELACAYAARNEDFGRQAAELGAVVAHLHAVLFRAIGPGPELDPALFMRVLRRRAAEAFADVLELAPYRTHVAELFDRVSDRLAAVVKHSGKVMPLQAIHGDLHLGQALFSPGGWKVLDFEGEPQRPVSERTAPDLPLRDVAGILRSLDYAAAVGQTTDPQWAGHAQINFLEGYREAQWRVSVEPDIATSELLLRALIVDKALYEVVYEFRHRPTWMHIPLAAVEHVLT